MDNDGQRESFTVPNTVWLWIIDKTSVDQNTSVVSPECNTMKFLNKLKLDMYKLSRKNMPKSILFRPNKTRDEQIDIILEWYAQVFCNLQY